jgi:DNA-binding NtrC family response regulator
MKKALVIDDTKGIRALLTECLELYGYEVFPASKGQEALDILQVESIDLAFIDIRMPEISGTEVLRRIREQGLKIPVVIMTAFATVKNAIECTRLGASAYLQKPFTAEKVRSVLNEIFENDSSPEYVEKDPLKCSLDLISKNNTIEALEILKKCLVDDLINPEVYYQIGLVYKANGNDKISEKFFEISRIFKEQ